FAGCNVNFCDDGTKRRRPVRTREFRERNALAVTTPGWRRRASRIGAKAELTLGQLRGFPASGWHHPQMPRRHVPGHQEMAVRYPENLVVRLDRGCVEGRILRDERNAFAVRTPGIVIHALF